VKKTLSVRPVGDRPEAPALQRKGRGWNIAESRLDSLHEAAREMKRNPSPAHALLAEKLAAAGLGKYRLRRQVVIGSAIVDFACQPLRLAVFVDDAADGVDPAIARRRDKSLETVGIAVMRVPAADVLADADGVTAGIVAVMKRRWEELRAHSRAQPDRRGSSAQTRGYTK
jgi:very-short-patch-repair endonuclease